jgi:MoaD family protein
MSGHVLLLLPAVKIIVRYYGMLHDLVGKRSEVLSMDGAKTASDIIEEISTKYGRGVQDFIFEGNGRIRSGLAFAVNGNSIPRSMLSKTECREISEFVILPPISGGIL